MTVKSRADLNTEADANLADNSSGDISASDVRTITKNLADSSFNLTTDDINDVPGVGTAASQASSAFATAAQGTTADAALPAASYTAADVLTKIKTVDGSGSGLDADLLDGQSSAAFAASAHTHLVADLSDASANAKSLLQSADYAAMRTLLDLEAGTDFNAFSARLADIAGITYNQGDILYYNGSNLVDLGPGTSGQFLKTQGAGANPVWDDAPGAGGGISNVVEDLTPQLGGNLDLNGFTAGAATAADLIKLNALTATLAELNFVDGVTSAIQTQIDGKQATDATLTALAAYSTNGLLTQTAADTFTGRTITGTANEITLANGNGVSGNPTVSLPSAITLTGKTITGGTFSSPTITGPKKLVTLTPLDNVPPATDYATLDWMVGTSTPAENIPVLDFDDTTAEYADFYCVMPTNYAGGGVTVAIMYSAAETSTDVIDWEVAFRRVADDAEDLDTTAQTYDFNDVVDTAPSVIGEVAYATITFTDGADMDSVTAGDYFILRVRRDPTPNSGTDVTGDASIHAIYIRET